MSEVEYEKGDMGAKLAYRKWARAIERLKGKKKKLDTRYKAAETFLGEALEKQKKRAKK